MEGRRRTRQAQRGTKNALGVKNEMLEHDGEGHGDGKKDERARWVSGIIRDYFRSHTLDQFLKDPANQEMVQTFLDNSTERRLYVLEKDGSNLEMTFRPMSETNKYKRMVYFTKMIDGPVSAENITQDVLVGDCNIDPVQYLEQVTQSIFAPLLSNSMNQASWSESVRKEMMESIHGFISNVQITTGLMRGETFLPLPNTDLLPSEEDQSLQQQQQQQQNERKDDDGTASERAKQNAKLLAAFGNQKSVLSATASAPTLSKLSPTSAGGNPAAAIDKETEQMLLQKERVHVFEGCLITWTKQIKNVLRMDPEARLKQGENPGPLEEIEFWKSKANNLNSIFEQLQTLQVRKVLKFLDASKSTYCQPFAKLCKESFEARDEANSNVAFMRPLVPWFEKLENGNDFDDLSNIFKPIMHIILLIWKSSSYYNAIARIVVLMREIANAVISRCVKYMNGPRLFELIEADETSKAYDMLKNILRVIGCFKSTYFDYKARANAECVSNPWRVQNNALFGRLDSFLERCHDLLDLTQTIAHFSKLNRIEVGGTKGKTLTTSVHQVHLDFETSIQTIKEVTYDVMDVDAKGFDDDFYEFRIKAKELERRVASVLTQAFDDCATIHGRFKLLDSFDQILERPIIQDELEHKHLSLLVSYGQDLALVQQEFNELKDDPPVAANLPPTAGALTWCRGLLERISQPMAKLRELNSSILDREGARDVIKTYTALVANLSEFEHDKIQAWEESIETSSISKLKLPLLRRVAEEKQLAVNFDPALVHLLREVKYFLLLGLKVPQNALSIYEKVEEFRRETGNLELIVQKYNKIQTTVLPVEKPLIRQHLSKIDKVINQGLRTLTWKSHGIESFIAEATTAVQEADEILSTMKESLKHVESLMERWAETSMITRISKAVNVQEFASNYKRDLHGKYQMITDGGKEIHKLLKEIVKKLKVSAGLPDWKAYVDFINNIVISGLCNTASVSLNYLKKEIDLEIIVAESKIPLIEVDLILSSRRVLFSPMLEQTSKGDGIRDEIARWIESIYGIGNLFKRLDSVNGSYLKEIVSDPSVMTIIASIHRNIDDTIDLAGHLHAKYCEYEYLWTTDLNAMFAEFLKTAFIPRKKRRRRRKSTNNNNDALDESGNPVNENGDGANNNDETKMEEDGGEEYDDDDDEEELLDENGKKKPRPGVCEAEGERPDLDKFEERINHFQALRVKISELAQSKAVGFLRVNTQPIKQALSTWITKWIYLFTQYLHDHVVRNLTELYNFVLETEKGLSFDVSATDFGDEALMHAMQHIRNVRKRMDSMERMFGPLGETMSLLKRHGISFDTDEIGDQSISEFYDHSPDLWDSTVNKAFKAKEVIQSKQNSMAARIKTKAKGFDARLKEFRAEFLGKAPFGTKSNELANPDIAYELLQQYHARLVVEREEAERLAELEDLFELDRSPVRELDEVETELGLLKRVWDMYCLVVNTFDSWKMVLWDEIDTESMEEAVLMLQNQIHSSLPSSVFSWPVYQALERRARNMSVVIPLVTDLHSPALRDRHWKQIMNVTSSQFEKGPRFCFQNILELHLHKHVDQVTEIVEVANKEMKIDQRLKSIEDAWVSLDLEYVAHKPGNPDFKIIGNPEPIIEALEENQLQLQTLAGLGKFVDFFRERVTNWQRTLGQIESNLTLWLRVQRTWDSLEAIFLSGSDIRSELPEDTKRFEGLDHMFKELMMETSKQPNAMHTCCQEGRFEMLSEMWNSLERCQKALNEYLEQKKNIFPRFFFVSNLALLDILSNGYEPTKIMPHINACFGGIKTLDLQLPSLEATETETKKKKGKRDSVVGPVADTAIAMISPENERVEFPHEFKISGPVEHWLNGVTEIMQETLQRVTSTALQKTANWDGDHPRDKWLFDFPGQVVLLASQVIWTDELRLAIEEVEGGQEGSMEKFLDLSNRRLRALIELVQGNLTPEDRVKIITLITLDVHGREVVEKLIQRKIENLDDFQWQSQLRFYWNDEDESCDVRITDFATKYSFEYIGNVDRLVITPLTDRCYITLTMALRLTLGGAPAGPAGTGKTETTKDLARSLGLACYVFNCSDQMNYQTIGDIFKGLAQTGAWGCFDEFNRIPIEVLSVVATQVKTILDAIRHLSDIGNREEPYDKRPSGKPPCVVGKFDFMGTKIALVPTTGFFITMNPGYAGRTELPENLKAHFRSCAMIRPDLQPICQNMLMAEGFVNAVPLSIKFVTLYKLSSELLSQQPHYDWGLRNVKSVLRVAGMLKRADPEVEETGILMRALRDFNVPKLPSFDLPIFLKLVDDLFPGIDLAPIFDEKLKQRAIKACRQTLMSKSTSKSLRNVTKSATPGASSAEGESEAKAEQDDTENSHNHSSVVGGLTTLLQPEEVFINKVVNLQEIMDVRHSVMLLGSPGCGKTSIWKTLAAAHNYGENKPTCVTEVLNPKSITSNELYGYVTLQKDWKDGALSIVMRNMSLNRAPYHPYQKHHWIVLDGDIDAIWIESMNTVMDDNKVLTLVSNERIQLTNKMRLIFEISTLKNATPATVSRAGILYINQDDIGWSPFVESWVLGSQRTEFEMSQLPLLFAKYMQGTIDLINEGNLQHIVPIEPIAMVQSTCHILEALLKQVHENKVAIDKEMIENLFVFSLIWAAGGALSAEKSHVDYRKRFSDAWLNKFGKVSKAINFVDPGSSEQAAASSTGGGALAADPGQQQQQRSGQLTVFDYFYDVEQKQMTPWYMKLDKEVQLADMKFSDMIVPTANSARLSFVMDLLVKHGRPVCLIGSSGTGKTTVIKEYLRSISDHRMNTTINMNYYTDSFALQLQLEQAIDKRSGRIYGPAGDKKLIYFVDDLNMPFVEEYGTQSPIALLRQFMDYNQWFDRQDLGLKKEIQDVQFLTAMNQKCGSFTINPRLQRHMTVLACEMPEYDSLQKIYGSILLSHVDSFPAPIQSNAHKFVDAAIELHSLVSAKFLPTATKFHYIFNMRDLSALFQGLLRSDSVNYSSLLSFSRLFLHESTRVFSDRLVNDKDIAAFDSILVGVAKKYFEEDPDVMFAQPLLFTNFIRAGSTNLLSTSGGEGQDFNGGGFGGGGTSSGKSSYMGVQSQKELQACLEEHLARYNSSKAKMELVLFTLASEHVCRIARIISNPGGNALLVGVGGSGKQSLSRLASFICGCDVFQISVTADYSLNDFKESLKNLYRRAGLRPRNPVVLLLTDSQIIDERFLVYVNDILSNGYIPDLFSPDEYDGLFASLRSEAKANGIPNSRSHMMDFFIGRVRQALHIILCHSPVGDTFRSRARKFPGLINCTTIDWFHPWPREALVAVASRFLGGIGSALGSDEVMENVMHHIAEVHLSVTEMSLRFREVQGRHNYVTPKSFLEMVNFYQHLLSSKRHKLHAALDRLRAGLDTLRNTASHVAVLQEDLKKTMVKVEERKAATEELLEQMGQQRGEAEVQQAIASKERIKAEKYATEAREIEEDAEIELAAAQPAMEQAEEAVNCLTKASLTELKSLQKPPNGVDKVTTCVLMMVKNEKRNFSWDNAKRMMGNIDKFKQSLEEYDSKNIPEEVIERVSPIVDDPEFTYDKLLKKSAAAANMATWVINILEFNKIYKKVKPLMDRLDEARAQKEQAMADLQQVEATLAEAEGRLNALQESFMHATNEKSKVEAEAASCNERLSLAERLVNGLSSENERWEKEIENLQYRMETVVGDTLLAAAFVSYIGPFDNDTRTTLWRDIWTSDLLSREIPLSEGVTPLQILTSDAEVASWGMNGLPVDNFSVENGALITSCSRWPLIIDPQLQGLNWLRNQFQKKKAPDVPKGKSKPSASQKDDSDNTTDTGSDAASVVSTQSNSNSRKSTMTKRQSVTSGNEKKKTAAVVLEDDQDSLIMLQLSHKSWLETLRKAVENGSTVILENVGEEIDSILDPLLSRSFFYKGKQPFLEIGGLEVEYSNSFKLILQTRLSNPHYKPETLAQCTLINFIVTESGLEDQLLARVVNLEKPELEHQKQELQRAFNEYKIQLVDLENILLEKLSNAPPDILSDVPMIESLEATKATASDIEEAVAKGKETEKVINEAREAYRPVAMESAMLYFMLLQLNSVNHMYQYSLESFTRYFEKAMRMAGPGEVINDSKKQSEDDETVDPTTAARVESLVRSIRITIYTMVSRGLFVQHKMVFLIQMTFNLLKRDVIKLKYQDDRFDAECLDFLLRAPQKFDMDNEIEWLPDPVWNSICGLSEISDFENLPMDMIESAPRFKEWYNATMPENEKLPLDWRELDRRPFLKILVVRALRPDRTLAALSRFVRQTLPNGDSFADSDGQLNSYQVLEQAFEDSSPEVPVYFLLSPGSDVAADVDKLAKAHSLIQGKNYFNISMGQGMDVTAMQCLENGHRSGWWVLLNNVHLMPSWLNVLSKKLDSLSGSKDAHANFRLFLSSDPTPVIPGSILDRSIKLTNEPPAGLKANLLRSWYSFTPSDVDNMEGKTRSILFGLCYFHSIMLERKVYQKKGFNLLYPFGGQDLAACSIVLKNYMDKLSSPKLPWDDLRVLFGEIIYGGHIVNDYDRRVCNTYLEYYMNDRILDELEFFPFTSGGPPAGASMGDGDGGDNDGGGGGSGGPGRGNSFVVNSMPTFTSYVEHIHDQLPGDTPLAFGLHPNAELSFRALENTNMFKILQGLQRNEDEDDGDGGHNSAQHLAEAILQDMLETYRDLRFDTNETISTLDNMLNPFQNMYVQECNRMQVLVDEMVRSLLELELGFRGELTMSPDMDKLMNSLCHDQVPESWIKIFGPTCRPLGAWLSDLQRRINQLQDFMNDPISTQNVTWLPGFFNPNAFLTAILQTNARETNTELDKLSIATEVLKRREADIKEPSRDGCFVTGLYLEGASWNYNDICLEEARPKETIVQMPIINIKAVSKDSKEVNMYQCPVYRTQQRSNTYIFTANLRTKIASAKWVLSQVVLLLDPSE